MTNSSRDQEPSTGISTSAARATGAADPAAAFGRLHPEVQRWVWSQGWSSLRTVQALAVEPILAGCDVLISAATAGGKTEAAWLPIASNISARLDAARDEHGQGRPPTPAAPGVRGLYIGPLKALINDQFLRLQTLGEDAGIPVHRWHGDVAASAKRKLRTHPEGILLITPESLEALFVREGPRVPVIFAGLQHIVIDEFHSFIGTERGAQLQSLMHRIDLALRRRVPRIGLSATLADLTHAAEYLRPGHGAGVALVASPHEDATEIRLQVRGYIRHNPETNTDIETGSNATTRDAAGRHEPDEEAAHSDDAVAIGRHIFETLRGADNLVFANSRSAVEAYTDILTRLSETARVPNEFLAHHGNLSKEHREDVENKLRSTETPASAICTSTLEMGIDIGSTDSVAQIGSPPGVASLRQRLGRSGRRGRPATLRAYVAEAEVTERTPPTDMLRAHLVQTVAMTELMLRERWYEPPNLSDLHLSTLIQQVLSVIAQHGGAKAAELFSALCGNGPFALVSQQVFVQLLRDMGEAGLLTQAGDGVLLAGPVGDRLVNHYSFYSAFKSGEEYRLMACGRTLGTIPVDFPVLVGSFLIFAGLRWQVVEVDATARIIELTRSSGGRPPSFTGNGAEVADKIRQRMRHLYLTAHTPAYLDATGQDLLTEGRNNFARLNLSQRSVVPWGSDTVLLPWRGDQILNTLAVAFASVEVPAAKDGVGLTIVHTHPTDVLTAAQQLVQAGEPDPEKLARSVSNKLRDKYDEFLSEDLLDLAYAAHALDVPGAWSVLAHLTTEPVESLDVFDPAPGLGTGATSSTERIELVRGGGDGGAVGVGDGESTSTAFSPALASVGQTPFAVIDVETTGIDSLREDRVVEVAIVQTDETGTPTATWSSLVNPLRDAGPAHVHGLVNADLAAAPRFNDIAEWIADQLAGRIVVGHNAEFDLAFLNVEFARADLEPPPWPVLDTLAVAESLAVFDDLTLAGCCAAAGVSLRAAHTAVGDALATAQLLAAQLRHAPAQAITALVDGKVVTPRTYPRPAAPRATPRQGYGALRYPLQ
ncbi:hypothetical protein GCM10011519_07420 [Marmoricola endophyticus]|uniref:DEAD/DEAH box helicase n=1 Tax=Marmoricola endophyticus TaxID=2040280 RepID=A0A917BCS4_9ACTN|nr:DEAD/DEAH box helicase [Marmoricola endophyticus]GGF36415.1 hypothetical protein GCM10011519_07420 [Marmoricola endophyticus]